ncbi:MAG: redox-sensing transcriptional repressor Rex [Acidimicrobiales bacterium]
MDPSHFRRIPPATVARLPVYFRVLEGESGDGVATISSERLAELAGLNAAKVRKDLSCLGSYGTRGAGYDVDFLLSQIGHELGLNQDWPVVIVGVGNLGRALVNYAGFQSRGFSVVALFDSDPAKVGQSVAGQVIRPVDDIVAVLGTASGTIGVVATPGGAAQGVVDALVSVGVTSVLNFAPTVLSVPEGVTVRDVDVSIELQILSFYQRQRARAG